MSDYRDCEWRKRNTLSSLDKKNQLDVTFLFLFSSNSCSTCFGQPCTHHQELTTAWCYSIVLEVRCSTNPSMDALPANRTWQPPRSHGTYQHKAVTSRSHQLLMMGTWLPETCWATIRREIKNTKVLTTSLQPWHIPTQGYNITRSSAPDGGHTVARNMLSNYQKRNKEYKKWHLVGFSYPHWIKELLVLEM